jgi:UPF0755 protein
MVKKLAIAVAAVVLLAVVALGGAWAWVSAAARGALGPADAPDIAFVVDKGATGLGLGPKLADAGLIKNPLFWRFHLRQRGGLKAKAGKHTLSARMTMPELSDALETAPPADDVPFGMIEGWRLRDTDAALVDKGLIKPGAYIAAARDSRRFKAPFPLPDKGLEGYLYPETYRIVVEDFSVERLIQRQLDTFVERFYVPYQQELASGGRSLHDVVTVASMLEREEPMPSQRATVAGIMWKRVDRGFALGVDATSRYELAEWNDRTEFLKHLRDKSDPYNTRHTPGLPPTPIGAPTVDSLVAAMRPVPSDFLYYLHDSQRILHPSRNAEEHEALRARYNVY